MPSRPRRDHDPVAKRSPLTRAQRREQQGALPTAGAYGIDAQDAGADSWIGRYVIHVESADEARAQISGAGFHKRQISAHWSPALQPPEELPTGLVAGDRHWYRSRFDDSGWTAWEQLPEDYRHPAQGQAAIDPTSR